MTIKRGQKYKWQGCYLEVIRVAINQAWADIHVYQPDTGASWSKRQPLPLPPEAQRIS